MGNGLPGRRVHGRVRPRRRHLPRPGPAQHRPLSRLPGHGRDDQHRQRGGRRPHHRRRRQLRARAVGHGAPGQLDGPRRTELVPRRPAVLLRLDERAPRRLVHRVHRPSAKHRAAARAAASRCRRGGGTARGARRPRRGQRGVLARRRGRWPQSGDQLLSRAGRSHRDGRGGRERQHLGVMDPRRRRVPRHRGHAARRPLLECVPRQLLVGDHRLRPAPVEPQRPPSRARRRRGLPGGGGPPRPGCGQLAGHGGQPSGGHDLPLAAGGRRPRCPRSAWLPSPSCPTCCRRPPPGSTPKPAAGCSTSVPAPCADASRDRSL